MYQTDSGYLIYVVFLLIIAGLLNVFVDAPQYKKKQMRREGKHAFFLGWINVAAGALLWIGDKVYSLFIA